MSPLKRSLSLDYSVLHAFGLCLLSLSLPLLQLHKLPFVIFGAFFWSYSSSRRGYRCLHLPSDSIYVSFNVVFDKSSFSYSKSHNPSSSPSSYKFWPLILKPQPSIKGHIPSNSPFNKVRYWSSLFYVQTDYSAQALCSDHSWSNPSFSKAKHNVYHHQTNSFLIFNRKDFGKSNPRFTEIWSIWIYCN